MEMNDDQYFLVCCHIQLLHDDFSPHTIVQCFMKKSMTVTKVYTTVTISFTNNKLHIPSFCEFH